MPAREPGPAVPGRRDERTPGDEIPIRSDPARLADGWERRFVIEGARVADYVRLYESLGYDVVADRVRAEAALDDCTDCRMLALLDFRVIYTRARSADSAR